MLYMPKLCYQGHRFDRSSKAIITRANEVLEEYSAQGFTLTLRQLYYQFVARGWLPNKQRCYKRLGEIVGNARLSGKIDWLHLEDRMRKLEALQHFAGPQDALNRLTAWYHVDMWESQEWRPEVWVEKDALSGVVARVCNQYDVPYFCCRGYTSLSEMWRASMRLRRHSELRQKPYIMHFGDHDPSGIDMSRDIFDRLHKTLGAECEFVREALTMEQVTELNPPPNPAKVTDSRYKTYVERFGDESWELDALEPKHIHDLVESRVKTLLDQKQWDADKAEKESVRARLQEVSKDWETIAKNKVLLRVVEGQLKRRESKVAALKKELELVKKRKKRARPN